MLRAPGLTDPATVSAGAVGALAAGPAPRRFPQPLLIDATLACIPPRPGRLPGMPDATPLGLGPRRVLQVRTAIEGPASLAMLEPGEHKLPGMAGTTASC